MKVLADPATGELMEVLEEALVGLTPYDFREAKAAHMRASIERRQAESEYEAAVEELARAERNYRMTLAQQLMRAKADHGATNAEAIAKGTAEVLDARERYVIADGMRYVKLEKIRRADGDRQGVAQLVKWSQAVATGPWGDS